MKLSFNILFFCVIFSLQAFTTGHTQTGTSYGDKDSKVYAVVRHGPDGVLFLDPYFLKYLNHLDGKTVLDAGCGAAPWAIYAAQNGAQVEGIDIQQSMIDQGLTAVQQANLKDRVRLIVGDVAHLPYVNANFDLAISINVGCNLPSIGLGAHIREMKRTLKKSGTIVMTAPASLDIVFTNGKLSRKKALQKINQALKKIGSSVDPQVITYHLNELREINRATFVHRNGALKLVTNEKELKTGEDIWRKLPGLVVPNRYHSEQEYLEKFARAGLNIRSIERPTFKDETERKTYNSKRDASMQLGKEYMKHHAFIIFVLANAS